jgi:hypothetical protein
VQSVAYAAGVLGKSTPIASLKEVKSSEDLVKVIQRHVTQDAHSFAPSRRDSGSESEVEEPEKPFEAAKIATNMFSVAI